MSVRNSASRFAFVSALPSGRLDIGAVARVALATGPIAVLALLLPAPLILPVISVGSMAIAVAIGLLARRSGGANRARGLATWDVAGAFMILGCIAGMLSEPEQALQLVGSAVTDR